MVKQSPTHFWSNQAWWENDCMEWNVVFAHKLIQTNVVRFPPLFILLTQKICCNWNVSNWSIKPNVKYLLFKLLKRNSYTPLQVSSNAFWFKTHVGPCFSCGNWIFRPFSFLTWLIDPFFQIFLNFRQINEEMNCLFKDWSAFTNVTVIIFHFSGIVEEFLTFITLISSCVLITAKWTRTTNKPISQKEIAFFAVALGHLFFFNSVFLLDVQKDILTNLSVPFCGCSSKVVKSNIEPLINIWVDFMIIITNFSWSLFLFQSFNFGGRAILISTTNVQDIWSLESLVSCVNIGRKDTANDITQVRYVIYIGKSRCDENILLTFLRDVFINNNWYFLVVELF